MALMSPVSTDGQVVVSEGQVTADDPPLVVTLVQPLSELRAALGTAAPQPDPALAAALVTASQQVAEAEHAHRGGIHALEAGWSSAGADAAVPALRSTQTALADLADRGGRYAGVLADAHATAAGAAARVDAVIADFRRDARAMLAGSPGNPHIDALVARAEAAMQAAVAEVAAAGAAMDRHSGLLDNDSAQATGCRLEQLLISAGVQLGLAVVTGAVDFGTHLIDKAAEVGTHAIDVLVGGHR